VTPRARLLLAGACAAWLTLAFAPARSTAQTAGADSLGDFLKGLADSTDTSYGAQSVTFDTTGLDTLALNALEKPPILKRRGGGPGISPLLGFHRAEGVIVGAGARVGSRQAGWLEPSGTYSFSNKEGRYAFGWRRTLLYRGPERRLTLVERGRIVPGTTRLDLELRYARASLPFAPEHATPRLGNLGAVVSGKNSSSLYEQRGFEGSLALWRGDVRLVAGVRHEDEEPMARVNDWTLLTAEANVPPNLAATNDRYTEPFGSLGFYRSDWEFGALLEARGGGADRWRSRAVLAKALRLGGSVKSYLQIEGGATAANAPPQRRFELGGGRAISSLPLESGGRDHLLLGKIEFVEAHDVLKAIGLPHPDWLVLQPMLAAQGGAVWDDAGGRNVLFSGPPSEAWCGAVGAGLIYRIGIPDPDAVARIYLTKPIGPNSGEMRVRFSLGTTFDLLGRL